jgi:hypothetical protein
MELNHQQLSNREFYVILHTGEDEPLQNAFALLASEFSSSLHPFAVVSLIENSAGWVDPYAHIYRAGRVERRNLIDFLAKELSSLEKLRIVSTTAEHLTPQTAANFDQFRSKLLELVKKMSASVSTFDYRIAFPEFAAVVPDESFFNQGANANLIVIPKDSSSHTSIARPVSKTDNALFAAHISIELATITGLWQEITDPVLDSIPRFLPGTSDVSVRFVSSRASYLVCPPLPIERLMSDEGVLPLPHNFYPTPDPLQAAERLGYLIYPDALRFNGTLFEHNPVEVSAKNARVSYIKEFFRAARGVPRALIRGVQDHLENMSGAALQEAVGGEQSSLAIIYPGRDENGNLVAISTESMQQVIDDIAGRLDRPVLTNIGEGLWVDMVDKIIAVADGGKIGAAVRSAYADEKLLLVEQSALAPMDDDLVSILREIYVEPKAIELVSTGSLVEEFDEVTAEDPEIVSHAEDLNTTSLPLEEIEVDSSNSQWSEISSDDLGTSDPVGSAISDEPSIVVSNLLREIAKQMAHQQERAKDRAKEMVSQLLAMPGEFSPRDATTISRSARIAVALGLSVIYFAFGALTDRRHLANFEFLGSSTRDLVWVLTSTTIVGVSLFGLFFKSASRSQGRIIFSVTALVSALGLEFVFWNSIRNFYLKFEFVRGSAIAGFLILIGTLVIVSVAVIRNQLSNSRIRPLFGATLASVGWIYAVIGITAVMGSDKSSLRNLESSTSNRFLFILLIIGLTLIVVSAFVVAYTIVQEKFRLDLMTSKLNWASSELTESADAERRLHLASIQWLGTSAVLARLFKFPLGSDFVQSTAEVVPLTKRVEALKFVQEPLVLTIRGEQGLSARLRQLFIGQGWLGRQYRQLVLRFQDDLAFSRGLNAIETKDERPESCTALPTLDDVFAGRARGSRWSFMKSVLSGEYDSALRDTTTEVQLEDAYSTVVVDSSAHSVGGSVGTTASEFLSRLIPEESIQLPSGLVTTLFIANDKRGHFAPHVWWPEELMGRPEHMSDEISYHQVPVLSPNKITSPIHLFGACVLLSGDFNLVDVMSQPMSEKSGNVSDDIFIEGSDI